ncbi:Integrase, catalytic core [Gossypium australe]|uniref:Integrase, catalytic core n=1 Tax=Gossypium australe TaxID=47621 RepID=A0A5B6VG66_9ROSI|nr:Integrase, catalytic core [Gossypium australe]
MKRRIIGIEANHNATIARSSDMCKKTVVLVINKQHLPKKERMIENLLFACHKAFEEQKNIWYLDSGCSNHMTRDKEVFLDINSTFRSKFKAKTTLESKPGNEARVQSPCFKRKNCCYNQKNINLIAKEENDSCLWHKRLGHLNYKGLELLA